MNIFIEDNKLVIEVTECDAEGRETVIDRGSISITSLWMAMPKSTVYQRPKEP